MPIQRALPVVLLLALVPLADAGDAYHGTVADIPDREFAVLAAQWGTGHRFKDVTEKARSLATDHGLDVRVERSHFGDPYPHFRKSLVVVYLWAGEIRSATAPEHGRLCIPPDDEEARRARLAWIEGRIDAVRKAVRSRLEAGIASGSPDEIRQAVRMDLRAAEHFARRYRGKLGEHGARVELRILNWTEDARRVVRGMREREVKVASSSDWRDLDIDVAAGDLVAIAAEGEWKLGTWAGVCGAAGLSGDRYRKHSTVEELRHGCLLVRAGSHLFVAGTAGGAVRIAEGVTRVEAKCNDETYRDNSGSMTLRVLVVPGGGAAE